MFSHMFILLCLEIRIMDRIQSPIRPSQNEHFKITGERKLSLLSYFIRHFNTYRSYIKENRTGTTTTRAMHT